MTNLKPKKGASQYRVIATFLSKWLQLFPTDETSLSKQKIKSENQKDWFAAAPGATGPKDAVPLFASVTQPGSGSITLASASYARWEW